MRDVVERLPEIAETLVIGAEEPDGDYQVPLSEVLAGGGELDGRLHIRVCDAIRTGGSPGYVPAEVLVVPGVARAHTSSLDRHVTLFWSAP
ncbi:hypothetical protein [Streptomyces sp. NBC_00631]|uniref:hypothetical protein n=1 Tax=Streptomyces sp. NBC_00631 TaxID=2975793 RepID=UPI0038636191